MSKRSVRKFTLLDAMGLTAAIAVGLALARMGAARVLDYDVAGFGGTGKWLIMAWLYLLVALPYVAPVAPVLLLLHLVPPRPRFSRLARQPGFVACLAISIVLAVRAIGFLVLGARTVGLPFGRVHSEDILTIDPFTILAGATGMAGTIKVPAFRAMIHLAPLASELGLAVAVAWAVLAVGRRWRPEPSWLDRAGRSLGYLWLAAAPLTCWWYYHLMY